MKNNNDSLRADHNNFKQKLTGHSKYQLQTLRVQSLSIPIQKIK